MICAMCAMFFYYALLIDLAVVSTRISAFFLACTRMLSEAALFVGALFMSILTFSCVVSVLKQANPDFAGMHRGAYALIRVVMGAYDSERYAKFRKEPMLLFAVVVFIILTVIFLFSMLIAQLSCKYSAAYRDMVGFARLERAGTIVEIMRHAPKRRWIAFVDALRLDKRLEFNPGDLGVAGGIAHKEPSNLHPTTVDMINRFGGSTSPEQRWPEEDNGDDDDRLERMEKLLKNASASRRDGGGVGNSGSGSGNRGGSSEGSQEDAGSQ
jgi:hypothetical protein